MKEIRGRGYVAGKGPMKPEIMVIGSHPGPKEIESGQPFMGSTGQVLDTVLEQAGLSRRDVYLTNVLKYQPDKECKLKDWQDYESVEFLWEEIEKVNPSKILALGTVPLHFITGKTGISEYRGSVLRSQKFNKVTVGTYNPAHLFYAKGGEISGYWQKHLIDFDVRRIKEVTTDFSPPRRHLWIARNSADVYRFFERNKDKRIVSVDIEVLRCVPCCISFAFNKNEAISIPLFRTIDGITVCSIPELDINEIWRLVDKILQEKMVEGQNFKFDQERLEHELCFKIRHFHSDTMMKAFVLNPELPKSQAFLASTLTLEPYYKDEGKEFNPKRDKIDVFLMYNAKDSAVHREISDIQDQDLKDCGLYDYYYGYYHHLHNFYYDMEQVGLGVDEKQREHLIHKYEGMLADVNTRLKKALGWVPRSVAGNSKELKLAVFETLKMPARESLDEESLVALSANHAKRPEQVEGLQCIIERRRLEKILGPDRLNFSPDWDGKARTSIRICGTETGRTSNALLQPPVRRMKTGIGFQTMSKHGDVGKDFRTMFVAPKGWVFVNVDLSQADARVVAILSEDYDLLELYDTIDAHRFTAAVFLEFAIVRKANTARKAIEMKDEVAKAISIVTGDERFIAKAVRHGCNYDMQKPRPMIDVNTKAKKFHIPVNISEWKAGKFLERVHAFTPSIKENYHKNIQAVIDNDRELVRPDGSKRIFFDRLGPELYREAYSDIPQHTVINQVRRAALDAKKDMPDMQFVIESHDAITFQCPEDEAIQRGRLVQKYMTRPIDFSLCSLKRGSLVIPSECEIGENYGDMKKVDLWK